MENSELPEHVSPQNTYLKNRCQKTQKVSGVPIIHVPADQLDSLHKQFEDILEVSENFSPKWSSPFSEEEPNSSLALIGKFASATKSLLAKIKPKAEQSAISSSDSENQTFEKSRRKFKSTRPTVTSPSAICGEALRGKKSQIGSFVFSDSSDESFVEINEHFLRSKHANPKPMKGNVKASMKLTAKDNNDNKITLKNERFLKLASKMVSIATQTTSVISGRLELSTKYFVQWSLCLNNVFASNVYFIDGYPFHIEIHSNPSLGYPGHGNEYFLPVSRKFAILLVCDYSFPEPTQSLECNFVVTLKAKNPMFNDMKMDYSNAFSAHNRAGGCVLSSELVANPNNGLLSRCDTLSIAIDVEFAAS